MRVDHALTFWGSVKCSMQIIARIKFLSPSHMVSMVLSLIIMMTTHDYALLPLCDILLFG